jgi:cytidylate kinase
LTIITISRQSGSLGREIAEQISEKLKMPLITRKRFVAEHFTDLATPYEMSMLEQSPKFYLNAAKDGISFKEHMQHRLMKEATKGSCVILGMGSQIIFANHPDAINIRVTASDAKRFEVFSKKYGLQATEAEKLLKQSDRRHKRFIYTLYELDWDDPLLYDIILNTDRMSIEHCVELIAFNISLNESLKFNKSINAENNMIKRFSESKPTFKHPAEEEFANILDMYGIVWQYEPNTFPVKWDAEGNVTMAISPDFYLPKFNTYIEITTMDQKYVTTKNKKVRLVRELYPNISINIVYKKDFYSLLERFGLSRKDEANEFNAD